MRAGEGVTIELRNAKPSARAVGFEDLAVGGLTEEDIEVVAAVGQGVGKSTCVLKHARR